MNRRTPKGYTLLEVVLSLVLTSLVLLCVAMAVDSQLRIGDAGRAHVEEAQLARVLLHRMADDIRSALVADPLGLADLASSTTGSESSTREQPGSGGSDETEPEESEDEPSAEATVETEATGTVESLVPSGTLGLYGEPDWLQVDIGRPSRLPRQSSTLDGEPWSCGAMGDIKTVAYSVVAVDESATDDAAASSGLIRREMDRSVTAWASEQGLEDSLLAAEVPIAPEVAAVGFRYSDGTTWCDSWDTAESGKLPLAVEISLSLRPIRQSGNWATALSSGETAYAEEELLVYRLIVDLPMARLEPASQGSADSEDAGMSEISDTDISPSDL